MTMTVSRLGHLGDGVIAQDGGDLFAPFTLPGEVVSGDPNGDRLENVRITTPSADRITPVCRHFKQCGGCQVQHASASFVEDWKARIVESALAAQGINVRVEQVFTAPPSSRRRARFAGRRTKKSAMIGFHRTASDQLVEVPDCKVLAPAILAALPMLRDVTARFASRKGVLGLQVTDTTTGLDIDITGVEISIPVDIAALIQIVQQANVARVSNNGEMLATFTDPKIYWDEIAVTPVAGGFLQATPEAEAALIDLVKATTKGAKRILDLFAGAGTFALPMSKQAEVEAYELDLRSIAAMDAAWRQAKGVRNLNAKVRDLFRAPLDVKELAGFDAAIIDPARAGAAAQMAELAASQIPVIASISCNPVTFARDARILIDGGYTLEKLQVIDQFRWSSHVELAARFTKRHMSG